MDMLSFDFMQRAFAAGIIIALLASIMGVFIVLRRMSMIGDSLSHAALAGVAGAMLIGINTSYGALAFSCIAAFLIEAIRSSFNKYAEVALAVVLSGGMGLAAVLISLGKSFNADLMSYLFGSLVAVSSQDLIIISILGSFLMFSMVLLYKELFAVTFDEETAKLAGIPVKAVNICFTLMTAVVVTLSIRIVGALLISALIVIPAAVSVQLAGSFKSTFFISAVVAVFSVISGLYISFLFDLAPGGTIVLIAAAILMIVLLVKKLKGALN